MYMADILTKGPHVAAAEFKARCLELIAHVRDARAEYVITRHGVPMARLVPYDAMAPTTAFGTMAGTVSYYDEPFAPVHGAWLQDAGGD
jgi:prevent-host-death family protein